MSKLYARDVRLVMQRERAAGADFDDAWSTAMAECTTTEDWGDESEDRLEGPALGFMKRVYRLAYVDHDETPSTALSDDLLPDAKDAAPKRERDESRCRSPKCPNPHGHGDRFCAEHSAIFDRVRKELDGEVNSRYRIVN